MTKNLLNKETSPYLLQHKDNPVNWYPWSEMAFEKAKNENKPILLSIGYSACHWCHVMAHESFEHEETAKIMNENFINIKLDREERPDLDGIYQNALALLGQQGGWPLTMFLGINKQPFWGGTYFPKEAKHGLPAFADVLSSIANSYKNDPSAITKNQKLIFEALSKLDTANTEATDIKELIQSAELSIIDSCDLRHGGLRGAPKFPQLFIYDFLLNLFIKDKDPKKLNIITTTLDNICSGGIYDHVGGGISRYSVDEFWLVPHFEKMLYDNAQLLLLLTKFYVVTKKFAYKEKALQIASWIMLEMQDKEGGYYSALDADSEGEEGKFYVWNYDELKNILKEDLSFFSNIFDISPEGNWEQNNILCRYEKLHVTEGEEVKIQSLLQKLYAYRTKRIRPLLDNKILTDWNGLTIEAMAYASVVFNKSEYLESATNAFNFISKTMSTTEGLYHSNCMNINKHFAMLDDYVHLTKGALMLYAIDGSQIYLDHSISYGNTILSNFSSQNGGFYTNSMEQTDVIMRNIQTFDNVIPNANSVLISIFYDLHIITSNKEYLIAQEKLVKKTLSEVSSQYLGITSFLKNQNLTKSKTLFIISGNNNEQNLDFRKEVFKYYADNSIIITIDSMSQLPEKFTFYKNINIAEKSAIYICKNNTCSLPITDINLLTELI